MLIALAVIFTILMVKEESKNNAGTGNQTSIAKTVAKVFPMFILWFLVMALLNTFGLFGKDMLNISKYLKTGYKFFVTAALAGVGFKIKFADLFTKGMKPIILGGCTWICIASCTMIFIHVFASYVG